MRSPHAALVVSPRFTLKSSRHVQGVQSSMIDNNSLPSVTTGPVSPRAPSAGSASPMSNKRISLFHAKQDFTSRLTDLNRGMHTDDEQKRSGYDRITELIHRMEHMEGTLPPLEKRVIALEAQTAKLGSDLLAERNSRLAAESKIQGNLEALRREMVSALQDHVDHYKIDHSFTVEKMTKIQNALEELGKDTRNANRELRQDMLDRNRDVLHRATSLVDKERSDRELHVKNEAAITEKAIQDVVADLSDTKKALAEANYSYKVDREELQQTLEALQQQQDRDRSAVSKVCNKEMAPLVEEIKSLKLEFSKEHNARLHQSGQFRSKVVQDLDDLKRQLEGYTKHEIKSHQKKSDEDWAMRLGDFMKKTAGHEQDMRNTIVNVQGGLDELGQQMASTENELLQMIMILQNTLQQHYPLRSTG